MANNRAKLKTTLLDGGVVILPTDTIYGIVGSALNRKTVARIYTLRRRNLRKPMIILIGSLDDLRLFDIKLTAATAKLLRKLWPGKVSVILHVRSKKQEAGSRNKADAFTYLHRGTNTLAFRLPRSAWLRKLLKETGPLVAPSANWEGSPPAKTIREAKKYFGPVRSRARAQARSGGASGRATSNGIDFYADAGRMDSAPSTLVEIKRGKLVVLRQGAKRV